jgi:hypothetical protein
MECMGCGTKKTCQTLQTADNLFLLATASCEKVAMKNNDVTFCCDSFSVIISNSKSHALQNK